MQLKKVQDTLNFFFELHPHPVLGGDKSHDPRIVHIIDRSLRKAKIFDVAIHKAEEQLGLFYSDLNDLDEKRRVFFYETVDDYVELISAEDKKMKRKNTENWNVRSDRYRGGGGG